MQHISVTVSASSEPHWLDPLVFWGIKAGRPTSSQPPFPLRQTMQTGLAHPQMRALPAAQPAFRGSILQDRHSTGRAGVPR